MRVNQMEQIAKALGKLQGQNEIDESTRKYCVDQVESVIIYCSSLFEKQTSGNLKRFREFAKVKV